MENTAKETLGNTSKIWGFIILLGVVFCLWGGSWIVLVWYIPDWQVRSSFGEMFGAVNALFSGAALAGVIYAVILQRRELELQRYELEMTRRELTRSAEAQEKSERALEEQARALSLTAKLNALNFLPTITCNIHIDDSKTHLTISNPGNTPAFDADALVIGYYHEEELDIPTFIQEYVIRAKKPDLKSNEEGFYGVFDHLINSVIPQRRMVIAKLDFPLQPGGVYVLMQFRDLQGSNYYQVYWFFRWDPETGNKDYRLGSVAPTTPTLFPRILWMPNHDLVPEDNSPRPAALGDFLLVWETSIAPSYTHASMRGPEDRGEWHDV